jgi:hypothetical protein
MKRKIGAILALALAATTFAPAASAQGWHRHYYGHGRGDAVAAGVVGLALGTVLGSAISEGHRGYRGYGCRYDCGGYYYDDDYDRGYYRDYYYRRPPAICVTRERRFDPYDGREVIIEERHYC